MFQNEHVFVTNDQQTVIVATRVNVCLDWSRWVTEILGDLANNATYIFSRTRLSESESVLGTTQELVLSQQPERVTVNITKEAK